MKKSSYVVLGVLLAAQAGNVFAQAELKDIDKQITKITAEARRDAVKAKKEAAAKAEAEEAHDKKVSSNSEKLDPRDPANENLMYLLTEHARELASIWGDTILEGDYKAKGDTHLVSVHAVKKDGKVDHYRIVYAEHAVWLGAEGVPPMPGKIVETGIISADLKNAEVDENHIARFIADR